MEQQLLRGGRYICLFGGLLYGYFNNQLLIHKQEQTLTKDHYFKKVEEIQKALSGDQEQFDFVDEK